MQSLAFSSSCPGSSFASATELDRDWELLPDVSPKRSLAEIRTDSSWRPARPGVCWNAQYDDLRSFMGVMWYRTSFEASSSTELPHLLLHFGAVDYYCEVFVNGEWAGSHEGGYTPFHFDIAPLVKAGKNELLVRVIDPPIEEAANLALCPEMMYNEIPHGKQSWYVQKGGIWQRVWLEERPAVYVDALLMTPAANGTFSAEVRLAGKGLAEPSLRAACLLLEIRNAVGELVAQESVPELPESGRLVIPGRVDDPQLWGPATPHLYSAEVRVGDSTASSKRVRFGFRSFEAHEGRFYLNGEPFYLRGVLDQDFHPETIHSPGSLDAIREMMLSAKRLGVNVLRCHLKVCAPSYLEAADELGLLVWTELPSWSDCWYPADHFSWKAAERSARMYEEVLHRDWNHPCIVIQTIMNESWGIDLKSADQRQWLKDRFHAVRRQLQPLGRLAIDNSACEKNFHLATDIEDFHNYYSMPDDAAKWEKWTAEFAARPDWSFSPYGDAERTGKEPLVVSEFGNWGLPRLNGESGEIPWWLNCDFGGRAMTCPTGVLERFRTYGFDSLFPDYAAMAEATQRHQFRSLKHQIEDMRQYGSIQGYVVTGMTDVHWEANGLLEMDRTPKVFSPDMSLLQRDDLLMLRSEKRNYWSREEVRLEVLLSHYTSLDLHGATVRWSVTGEGDGGSETELQGAFTVTERPSPGRVCSLGEIGFTAPEMSENQRFPVYVELTSRIGEVISVNSLDLFFYSASPVGEKSPILFYDPAGRSPEVARAMRRAGRDVRDASDANGTGGTMIATRLDAISRTHLECGGALLLLCNSEDALPQGHPWKVRGRAGCELDGRWFSNYNYIRAERGLHAPLNFGVITGFEAEGVTPRFVIQGLRPEEFRGIFAGVTYGWLADNSALALEMEEGGSRAVATTYCLNGYGVDPYATHLLDRLLQAAQRAVPVARPVRGMVPVL